jgi:hypothetical protein
VQDHGREIIIICAIHYKIKMALSITVANIGADGRLANNIVCMEHEASKALATTKIVV